MSRVTIQIKNRCVLDLEFGLPSYIRDSVLDESEIVLGPKAEVTSAYQTEIALKQFKEGRGKNLSGFNSNDNLLKLAR
jgi:hypothetical protein